MGVWIEITGEVMSDEQIHVTPLVGVWIEIWRPAVRPQDAARVTPLVGVWIEI